MAKVIIDTETGEVIREFTHQEAMCINNNGDNIVVLKKGDRVMRKKSVDNLNEATQVKMNDFVKIELGDIDLSVYESFILLKISSRIEYLSNRLTSGKNDLKASDIKKMCGISERKVYEVMKSLEEKGIIKKSDGVFYLNPYKVLKGNMVLDTTLALFEGDK